LKRFRPILICLASLIAVTVIFSTRSKVLDLLFGPVLFAGQFVLAMLAATQLRLHRSPDGQKRFRYRPNSKIPGLWLFGFPAKWVRWMADEAASSETSRGGRRLAP
jgi:hypothetical protein